MKRFSRQTLPPVPLEKKVEPPTDGEYRLMPAATPTDEAALRRYLREWKERRQRDG